MATEFVTLGAAFYRDWNLSEIADHHINQSRLDEQLWKTAKIVYSHFCSISLAVGR